jgi:hypothetical protein
MSREHKLKTSINALPTLKGSVRNVLSIGENFNQCSPHPEGFRLQCFIYRGKQGQNYDMSGKIFVCPEKLRYIRKSICTFGKNWRHRPPPPPPPPRQQFWEKNINIEASVTGPGRNIFINFNFYNINCNVLILIFKIKIYIFHFFQYLHFRGP